jgi:hypothetical protein
MERPLAAEVDAGIDCRARPRTRHRLHEPRMARGDSKFFTADFPKKELFFAEPRQTVVSAMSQ